MTAQRLRVAGLALGLFLAAAFLASADWKDPAPTPSKDPWVFDFGKGWFTAHVEGQGVLLLLKKFPPELEGKLVTFGIGGFEVMQPAANNRLVNAKGELKITIQIHFRVELARIVLMTDNGAARLEVPLKTGTFEGEGFAGTLADNGKGNFTLVLKKWPPGDPLMGS